MFVTGYSIALHKQSIVYCGSSSNINKSMVAPVFRDVLSEHPNVCPRNNSKAQLNR